LERRLAAILAADVVGYTRLMESDEAGTLAALKAHREEFIDPGIAEYRGRIVKLMGDGALVEFASAVDAVACAAALQRGLAERNTGVPEDRRIVFRIGINLGEVIIEGDDIYGDGVNLAARLEGLAEPGGICISAKVHEEVKSRLDLEFEDLGRREVKNLSQPVHMFRVVTESHSSPGAPPAEDSLALPSKPSIAVLPFDNMSGDPEQEYFSDGMTEDIITELSRFRSIFVIARNSSFAYKGRAKDIKQVGRDLGVRYVLEGSVRKSAGRVRITAQLIEATTGNHLWAQRYDRVLEDVFELQDEITETIVAAIEPELESAERERARRKPPDSLDAWESCQRGMWHAYKMTSEDAKRAEACFRAALASAPQLAAALAGLAYIDFHRVILNYGDMEQVSREALLDRALEEASAAVQSDDQDAFAQYVLGRLLALKGRFDEALERLTLAVELNPNSALARHGLGYALAVGGRPAEAEAEFDTALRLSPKDPYRFAFSTMRAFALVLTKDYEGAVQWGRKGIRDHAKMFWPYVHVASALGHLGRDEEAKRIVGDLLQLKPDFSAATIDETIRIRNPADREHFLEGLRKAGLPE
jgi:adenylate cyclase